MPKKHCKQVPKKVEKSVPRTKCKKVPEKKCQDVPIHVPRKECKDFPKTVCTQDPINVKKKIPKKVCVQIPKEVCNEIPRQIIKEVPKKVSKEVCSSTKQSGHAHSGSSYQVISTRYDTPYHQDTQHFNHIPPHTDTYYATPPHEDTSPHYYGNPSATKAQTFHPQSYDNQLPPSTAQSGYSHLYGQKQNIQVDHEVALIPPSDHWGLGPGK